MAMLHELHINQHTMERLSLCLFSLPNVNVRKVTEYSKDTQDSFCILEKLQNLLQG